MCCRSGGDDRDMYVYGVSQELTMQVTVGVNFSSFVSTGLVLLILLEGLNQMYSLFGHVVLSGVCT